MPIVQTIDELASKGNSLLWEEPLWSGGWSFMVLVSLLMAAGFTVYLGFVQIRGFRHGIKVALGKYDDPDDPGDVSHFQALATALSGTVGLGNIAGVAVAVSMGGPGVTVWMILIGLLAMASKYAECTLSCMFRRYAKDGAVLGGPMYYLERMGRIGKALAIAFALVIAFSSLGGSNAFQANQVAAAFEHSFSVPPIWTGIGLCFLATLVIAGGIKRLGKVSGSLVPVMAVGYIGCCLWVIASHYQEVPAAVLRIIHDAFSGTDSIGAFKGAVVGTVISHAMQRALFSCEAGQGSAAIAHAAAKTKEAVREGHVALLEPFIDTVVICSITAVTIGVTEAWHSGSGGVNITQQALGPFLGKYFLPFAVLLFAFSTIISWWYYGTQGVKYAAGNRRWATIAFGVLYLASTVLGSVWSMHTILNLAGIGMGAMMTVNGIALVFHARRLKAESQRYRRLYY
ncbi:MAG: sodium:alanine symporter family protein [Deltaproteobacteria bacterium]|nr:sodium:alanine symporter family protein [Deltaproteobacteria bacterium]